MKIVKIEDLHCDAGWRVNSFLKVTTDDGIVRLGAEVRQKGFKGLKTNIIRFDKDQPYIHGPGTNAAPGFPELNISKPVVDAAYNQLAAFREGAGPDVALYLDTNFNYKI